jgi:hypothetical protein
MSMKTIILTTRIHWAPVLKYAGRDIDARKTIESRAIFASNKVHNKLERAGFSRSIGANKTHYVAPEQRERNPVQFKTLK